MNQIMQRLHAINTSQTLMMPFRFAGKERNKVDSSYMIIKIPPFNEKEFYKMFNIYDLIAKEQTIELFIESYKDLLYEYLINKNCYEACSYSVSHYRHQRFTNFTPKFNHLTCT